MQIRQFTASDLDAVLLSWELASKLAHPFLEEQFLAQERQNIPEMYLPNADTWVADVDGIVVGFIALIGNEIGALFLQPAFHGKGIGRALMDKAQALHGNLEVEVFRDNPIGRKFYASYGFEQLEAKIHEPSGQQLLRLKYTADPIS